MASEHACYGPDDRAVATTPMFHGAGFLMALAPVFFGGFVELLPSFNIEQLMLKIQETAATSVYMVPTHFSSLFAMGKAEMPLGQVGNSQHSLREPGIGERSLALANGHLVRRAAGRREDPVRNGDRMGAVRAGERGHSCCPTNSRRRCNLGLRQAQHAGIEPMIWVEGSLQPRQEIPVNG